MARVDQRACCLDRCLDHLAQRVGAAAQCEAPACDARDVQQVVQQQGHVTHLALDDLVAPALLGLGGLRQARHRAGLADRRKRIAQLVGQRRQEFVLAAIGVLQQALVVLARGDVGEPQRDGPVHRRGDAPEPLLGAFVVHQGLELARLVGVDHRHVLPEGFAGGPARGQHILHTLAGEGGDRAVQRLCGGVVDIGPFEVDHLAAGVFAHWRQHDEGHGRRVEHGLEAPLRFLVGRLRLRPLDERGGLVRADVGQRAFAFRGRVLRVEMDGQRAKGLVALAHQRRGMDGAETLLARQRAQARIDGVDFGVGDDRAFARRAADGAGAVDTARLHQARDGIGGESGAGGNAQRAGGGVEQRQQAAPGAVEVGERHQDHLQLFGQRARVQQPAAEFVQAVQVGHLLAQFGLGAPQQVVDGAAFGDVDAGAAQAHRALAGPDDVHAQHQPAFAAVGQPEPHLALVAGGALAQLAGDDRARLERHLGRHVRHHVVQRHGAVRHVDPAQQGERRRQVGDARRQVEIEDADAGVLAGQHQALFRGGRACARQAHARAQRGEQHAQHRIDQQRKRVGGVLHPPAARRREPQHDARETDARDEQARAAAAAGGGGHDRRQEEQERDLAADPGPHRPLQRHGERRQGDGNGPSLQVVRVGEGGTHGGRAGVSEGGARLQEYWMARRPATVGPEPTAGCG